MFRLGIKTLIQIDNIKTNVQYSISYFLINALIVTYGFDLLSLTSLSRVWKIDESSANDTVFYTIQYFRGATHHTFVFNMVCLGMCKCNHMSFSYMPEFTLYKYIHIHKIPLKTVNILKQFCKADLLLTSLPILITHHFVFIYVTYKLCKFTKKCNNWTTPSISYI